VTWGGDSGAVDPHAHRSTQAFPLRFNRNLNVGRSGAHLQSQDNDPGARRRSVSGCALQFDLP